VGLIRVPRIGGESSQYPSAVADRIAEREETLEPEDALHGFRSEPEGEPEAPAQLTRRHEEVGRELVNGTSSPWLEPSHGLHNRGIGIGSGQAPRQDPLLQDGSRSPWCWRLRGPFPEHPSDSAEQLL